MMILREQVILVDENDPTLGGTNSGQIPQFKVNSMIPIKCIM
jgi:hypothetical protein